MRYKKAAVGSISYCDSWFNFTMQRIKSSLLCTRRGRKEQRRKEYTRSEFYMAGGHTTNG